MLITFFDSAHNDIMRSFQTEYARPKLLNKGIFNCVDKVTEH